MIRAVIANRLTEIVLVAMSNMISKADPWPEANADRLVDFS